jgi:hypothetical protein
MHWNDGDIIDSLNRASWNPDVVLGAFGTSGGRITDALRYYGLRNAYVEYSGFGSAGWEELWKKLRFFLGALRTPVPVLVDVGALGGTWYTAHWPIAYRLGNNDEVYLENFVNGNNTWLVVNKDTFLHAWHCNFLPLGFNHCAVFYYSAWG